MYLKYDILHDGFKLVDHLLTFHKHKVRLDLEHLNVAAENIAACVLKCWMSWENSMASFKLLTCFVNAMCYENEVNYCKKHFISSKSFCHLGDFSWFICYPSFCRVFFNVTVSSFYYRGNAKNIYHHQDYLFST